MTRKGFFVRRSIALIILAGVFIYELFAASFAVAKAALSRKIETSPAIVGVPISLHTDFAIAILANCVSLTPGTIALHISDDHNTLYIHILNGPDRDEVIDHIRRNFEDRLKEIEGWI